MRRMHSVSILIIIIGAFSFLLAWGYYAFLKISMAIISSPTYGGM